MLAFRSEAHLDKWLADWKMPRGAAVSYDLCWRLAQAWYGPDRRARDWRRKTVDEAEAVFTSLGLTAPFWNLRAA